MSLLERTKFQFKDSFDPCVKGNLNTSSNSMLISFNAVLIKSDGIWENLDFYLSNHSSVITVKRILSLFCYKFCLLHHDSGYPQVSGADQVIGLITSNLQVPIR